MQSPFAPIPGSGPPPRGMFIDHWGTLLQAPETGTSPRFRSELVFDGALDALFQAGQQGWQLYLLGNERSVAHGEQSLESWQAFESDLLDHLRSHGIPVNRSYICVDDPNGQEPFTKDSVYFLPNTGPMYHALQSEQITLSHSWVIGDSTLELVAGWRAGCQTAGVRTGLAVRDGQLHVEPDFLANDLPEVLREIMTGSLSPRP